MSDDPNKPRCAQAAPFLLELTPGEYRWCGCGHSQRQPFCDDSHAGTDMRPLRFTVRGKPRLVWLCGCKRSRSRPYCDGTHNRLPTCAQRDCMS